MSMEPRGWYSRNYLPHFDGGDITQYVTFCLWDAIPHVVLRRWKEEFASLPEIERERERKQRIEAYLDRGEGHAWLAIPELADLVQGTFQFFHGQRYLLHAWVVMPNHGHVLFTPIPDFSMESILHSWKSYTAHKADEILGKRGEFWFPESFDRYIRDNQHYQNAKRYIENNPVKAGLCRLPEEWLWSSANWRHAHPNFVLTDPENYR